MDRKLKKKKWPKILMFASAGIALMAIILYMLLRSKDSRLNVNTEHITISMVKKGVPILRLSNTNLLLEIMNRHAESGLFHSA